MTGHLSGREAMMLNAQTSGSRYAAAVGEGTVLYWGRRVWAQRADDGTVRFRVGERWFEANYPTAATFVLKGDPIPSRVSPLQE